MDMIMGVPAQSREDSDQKIGKAVWMSSSLDRESPVITILSSPAVGVAHLLLVIVWTLLTLLEPLLTKQSKNTSPWCLYLNSISGSPSALLSPVGVGVNGGQTKLRVAESILDTSDKEEGDIDSPAQAYCEVLATFLFFSGPRLPHLENGIRRGTA